MQESAAFLKDKIFTLYLTAAAQGHAHILQWLIGAGANMSLRNMGGKTPADVARRFGNRNCVKILGGNPGIVDKLSKKVLLSIDKLKMNYGNIWL